MCRALKVLCAAPGRDALATLKRAAGSASWELVGGATTLDDLDEQLRRWSPDVVVVDGSFGTKAVKLVRSIRASARIVAVGDSGQVSAGSDGPDARARSIDQIRDSIIGLPRPGGPVRA